MMTFLGSCGTIENLRLPEEFFTLKEEEKIDWLRINLTPDSVARLICNNASDLDTLMRIEDIGATLRILYTQYNDSDRYVFGNEVNRHSAALPSQNKMKLYKRAQRENPRRFGYMYGKDCCLNQTDTISVASDLRALKEICDNEDSYFQLFREGMVTAVKIIQKSN